MKGCTFMADLTASQQATLDAARQELATPPTDPTLTGPKDNCVLNPDDAHSYFQFDAGSMSWAKYSCPSGTLFNSTKSECDFSNTVSLDENPALR